MGGFGGSLKNITIRCADRIGKKMVHAAPDNEADIAGFPKGEPYHANMVESAKATAPLKAPPDPLFFLASQIRRPEKKLPNT